MKKLLTYGLAAIVITACASNPTPGPFDWQTFVIPLENDEYITDVQSEDKNNAAEVAVKAAYGACENVNSTPIFIERTTTRTGIMGEKTASAYDVAQRAATLLGSWTPNINDGEYTAAFRFRCKENKS